eukprot:GHUV01030598.1.p1 GENE.GHUV01030598.1~~GHUV01030598.1.p1  ORF type:complete len:223 (+),score=25.62 GHUV01030598.1:877-1545(+)
MAKSNTAVAAALLLVHLGYIDAVHHDGDFIHTSRRAQFLKKRTHWHDLIEHHCPRFARTRIVALPISKPGSEGEEVNDYRIQLSFDGDRILTPWLTVIGKNVEGMPLLEVQLRRAGDELTGVKARVVPLPDDMLIRHATLYEDYKNTTHWPKHVMVHYHWIDEGDIDFNKGLYVLMTTGRLGVVQVASYLALWGDTAEHAGLLCAPLNLKLPVITSSQSADW